MPAPQNMTTGRVPPEPIERRALTGMACRFIQCRFIEYSKDRGSRHLGFHARVLEGTGARRFSQPFSVCVLAVAELLAWHDGVRRHKSSAFSLDPVRGPMAL